ncbi:MAG: SDR family NAD(P)-dependent oxidoreductase [Chloroflexota bacterium]
MTSRPWSKALVVGASSGIGEALARELAAGGADVALVARRADRLDVIAGEIGPGNGLVFPHDVRDVAGIPDLFQRITDDLGGLDLVIYSSGIMPSVELDEFSTEKDIDIIDTNFAGAVAWLNQAADRFGRAGRGTIVGISSVAGDRGRAGNPVYNASKAALTSYLESLRNRLAGRGVRVVTIKPGRVNTAMLGDNRSPLSLGVSPGGVAGHILKAAAGGKRVVYVPGWWRPIMLVVRLLPAQVMERLKA